MTDDLRERIKVMRERAVAAVHEQFCGILNECQTPVIVDIATRDLIAEVERLEREHAKLQQFCDEFVFNESGGSEEQVETLRQFHGKD